MLLQILAQSGYPGYDSPDDASIQEMKKRVDERYTSKYGTASFIPEKILQQVEVQQKASAALAVPDKVMTPAEGETSLDVWERQTRPDSIVAESSTKGQSNICLLYTSPSPRDRG